MLIFFHPHNRRKVIFGILVVAVLVYFFLIRPALGLISAFEKTQETAKVTVAAATSFDIAAFNRSLPALENNLKETSKKLGFFRFAGFVPFFGGFFTDAAHLISGSEHLLKAAKVAAKLLEPQINRLGITPGQDIPPNLRVKVVIESLSILAPNLDQLDPEIKLAKAEIDKVEGSYPPLFGLRRISNQVTAAKQLVTQAEFFLVEAKPLIVKMPSIAGLDRPKNYLVLFQNDKELRPSGGFLTAYTFAKLDRGNLTTSGSNDIYSLDEQINRVCLNKICPLAPPLPIVKYLPEPTGQRKQAIESRDSNISPDWAVAATEFERFYKIVGGAQLDGIIGVDTFLVQNLLAVTGSVSVGGYQIKFDKDNVVEELLTYADTVFTGKAGRKAVLGDLMNSILLHVIGAPKEKFPQIIAGLLKSANEKHLLFYFKDDQIQAAFEKLNWAGRIADFPGDYLAVVDANFAGGKANLFVEQEVKQNLKIEGDKVIKEITISYRNPEKYNNKRNPGYRDWVRVYLPKGTKLITGGGSLDGIRESEELGKTVFDGFITVRPDGGLAKIELIVELPIKLKKGQTWRLLIQKQSGTNNVKHTLSIVGKQVEKPFVLKTDRFIEVKI